jgi:hypothetical protein
MALSAQANPRDGGDRNKLHISAEGNRMQLSLALTKDEFAKPSRGPDGAHAAGTASSAQPAPPPVRQPSRPIRARSRFMVWKAVRA